MALSSRLFFALLILVFAGAKARAQAPEPPTQVEPPDADAGTPEADAGGPQSESEAGPAAPPEPESAPGPQEPFDPFASADDDLDDTEQPAPAGASEAAPGSDAAETETIEPPDSLFEVEAIEVTAGGLEDLRTVGGGANFVSEEQLEAFRYDDPNQVLLEVPGVYVRSEDGYGLRPNIGLRGVSSDRSKKVTLMEDGVLFAPAPYTASAAYYFPLMSQVTGVEVFKGPAALVGGPHTVGGSINLRTREIPDQGWIAEVDGSGGSYRYGNVHGYAGYGAQNWGLLAEASHLQTNGYKNLDGGGDTGFSKQEGRLRFRVNSDPGARIYQRLDLKVGYAHEDSNETYLGLSDADFRDTPLRRYAATQQGNMGWWRTQGVVRYALGVDAIDYELTLYRHDFDRLWVRFDNIAGQNVFDLLRNPTGAQDNLLLDVLRGEEDSINVGSDGNLVVANNQRRFVSQGIDNRLTAGFDTGPLQHEINAGARLHYDEIVRDHTHDIYLMQSGQMVGSGADPVTVNDSTASTFALALHLVDKLVWERLTLSPGVRSELVFNRAVNRLAPADDRRTTHQQHALLFGAGAHYALTDTLGALVGVHQGFSPAPVAIVAPGGSADAEGGGGQQADPERAVDYEAGLRWIDGAHMLEGLAFVNDYSNILTTGDGTDTVASNGGAALVWGAELGGHYTVDLPAQFSMPLHASYTYTYGEFRSTFDSSDNTIGDVTNGDRLTYLPPHQFWGAAGVNWSDVVGFVVGLKFIDAMREVPGTGKPAPDARTDRFTLLDVSAYWNVIEQVKVFAKADNLTNQHPLAARRPLGGARPVKPLTVQLGAQWEL